MSQTVLVEHKCSQRNEQLLCNKQGWYLRGPRTPSLHGSSLSAHTLGVISSSPMSLNTLYMLMNHTFISLARTPSLNSRHNNIAIWMSNRHFKLQYPKLRPLTVPSN